MILQTGPAVRRLQNCVNIISRKRIYGDTDPELHINKNLKAVQERKQKILKLSNEGFNGTEIAGKLSLSKTWVYKFLKEVA